MMQCGRFHTCDSCDTVRVKQGELSEYEGGRQKTFIISETRNGQDEEIDEFYLQIRFKILIQ